MGIQRKKEGFKDMQFVSGKAKHQLDAKNRTRIPAKFKNAFPQNEKLFFVKYTTGCVAIMCESVMERKLLSFSDVDPADEDVYDAKRYIYTVVDDVVEDSQHRFMIPKEYREFANLTKDLVSVGMGDYIEIWDEKTLEGKLNGMTVAEANRIKKAYMEKQEKQ